MPGLIRHLRQRKNAGPKACVSPINSAGRCASNDVKIIVDDGVVKICLL